MAIEIANLKKGGVLAALFNAAKPPSRYGAFQFQNGPYLMNEDWGERIIQLGRHSLPDYPVSVQELDTYSLYFDHVYGRSMDIDLSSDIVDVCSYNNRNGECVAEKAIDLYRHQGAVHDVPKCTADQWFSDVVSKALKRYDDDDVLGVFTKFIIGLAQHPQTEATAYRDGIVEALVEALKQGRQETELVMWSFKE